MKDRRNLVIKPFILTLYLLIFLLLTGCTEGYMHESDKYNNYIDFYNQISLILTKDISLYDNTFGHTDTIQIKEDFQQFTLSVPTEMQYAACDYIMKNSSKKPTFKGLDEAAYALAEKVKLMYDILIKLSNYYNNNTWQTDAFKQGQELHTELITFLPDFYWAYQEFDYYLSKLEIEKLEKSLKHYSDGKNDYAYYALKCIIDGKNILNYFYENNITDDTLLNTNVKEFSAFYNEIDSHYAEFSKVLMQADYNSTTNPSLEQALNMLAHTAAQIELILQSQDINVRLPDIANNDKIVASESTPILHFQQYLFNAVSNYNIH